MIRVGSKVRITDKAWARFQAAIGRPSPHPGVQIVTDMPAHPPFHDKFLLSYPLHWWTKEDLQEIGP